MNIFKFLICFVSINLSCFAQKNEVKRTSFKELSVEPIYCNNDQLSSTTTKQGDLIYSFENDELFVKLIDNESVRTIFQISNLNFCSIFSDYLHKSSDEVLLYISVKIKKGEPKKEYYYIERRDFKNKKVIDTEKASFLFTPDFVVDKDNSTWHKLNDIDIIYNNKLEKAFVEKTYTLSFVIREKK